jgi:proteic killer suppression protein
MRILRCLYTACGPMVETADSRKKMTNLINFCQDLRTIAGLKNWCDCMQRPASLRSSTARPYVTDYTGSKRQSQAKNNARASFPERGKSSRALPRLATRGRNGASLRRGGKLAVGCSFGASISPAWRYYHNTLLLYMLNRAINLNDLKIPPSNSLEKLKGSRKDQYSIRINKQWRVCFNWNNGEAFDVEITDYH